MSKFCGNCGAQLPDDAFVCGMCGKSVTPTPTQNQSPYQASAPQQYYNNAPNPAPDTAAKKPNFFVGIMNTAKSKSDEFIGKCKSDKKFMTMAIAIGGGGLTVLIALIIILICVFGGGYEDAIQNKIDAQLGDYDAYIDCYPEAYWEDHEEPDEYEFIYNNDWVDDFDDYDIDFEVIDEDEIEGSDFTALKSDLRLSWGVSKKDITKAYELQVLYCNETDDEDYYYLQTVTVAEIDGDWYVVN